MRRAALYLRVSVLDQNPDAQGIELRAFAGERGYEIVKEYIDHGVSGAKVRRPALDQMLKDANRRKFDAVLILSCDRLDRGTKRFLDFLKKLNELASASYPSGKLSIQRARWVRLFWSSLELFQNSKGRSS